MKAAWSWNLPTDTEREQRELVALAHSTGFDTLIIRNPTEFMVEEGHEFGIKVIAIVYPYDAESFGARFQDCFQKILPEEEQIQKAAGKLDMTRTYRWYQVVQNRIPLCFEKLESQEELKRRVTKALEIADGIAYDGFGFANHYGCFCERCEEIREARQAAQPDQDPVNVMAQMSEDSLVGISEVLYDHAQQVKKNAIVTNHLWPPFRPNPYYGHRLRMDYCSQTISWFHKPSWSLERVALEAKEMKRLENPQRNRFAPFIGVFHDPHLVRSEERIEQEMRIALEYGEGNMIFCILKTLKEHPNLAKVVASILKDSE